MRSLSRAAGDGPRAAGLLRRAAALLGSVCRSLTGRYVVAIGLVAVVLASKALYAPLGQDVPLLLLDAAVVLAAWCGGRGSAVVAVVLAMLAANVFLQPPYGPVRSTSVAVRLGVFAIEASVVGALAVAVKEARGVAEQSARKSERAGERFKSVLMQAPIAVGVYSGPDHVLRLANPRWFEVVGTSVVVSRGKRLGEIVPKLVDGCLAAVLDEVYALGEPRDCIETPCERRSAEGAVEIRYYNAAIQPLREADGAVHDLIVTLSDVTEQVAARRAIEEARGAAEQASRAKDEFLRIASHELRTPLTPLLGWAQILQREAGRDPRQLQRGLDVILVNARAEARLVEDLLDTSRILAGCLTMEMRPLDLAPLVHACVDEARPAAAARGVALTAVIAPAATLAGDAARLQQVVRHLLSNAIKFTPAGGRVSVLLTREQDGLRLEVRDTGKGIAPCQIARVFEPFYAGDQSLTRTEGGLGLGLSIVRYVVEGHGGTVRVESAGPGRGAKLVVELGATAREHEATETETVRPPVAAGA